MTQTAMTRPTPGEDALAAVAPGVTTLVDLVAVGAERFARRPALLIRPSFRTRTWRHRDLGRDVPRIARVIADVGVGPGDRVIVWSVNRPEWGLAFLAIAHAGAVSVPLDVRHTVEFGRKIAERTEARLVIASRQTEASARELGLPILFVEELPDLARPLEPLPPATVAPDDLAEIVFTSGTTGEPKGAMLSHRNLLACAGAMASLLPFGSADRLLSVLPLSHLYEQVLGFIAPLLKGASIVYPVSRQPAVLLRTFRDYRASLLLIVPQGLRLLDNSIERKVDQAGKRATWERLHRIARRSPRWVRRLLFRSVHQQFGGRLKAIGVGASAIELDVAQRWTDMGVEVLQGYGATEMGPVATFTRPERNRLETVGEPIPGVEVRLAEDGEILARGPNRFLGYWRDPVATAAAIDPDGWYHSGDLGAWSPDGFLVFRGRKKDMLALPDGQKVYAEDVEAVLRLDERVQDAAVIGWPIGPDLRVHAVLLMEDPAQAEDVVRTANDRLAPHQRIRGRTVWPDPDLPRTHTLKIRKPDVLARLAELEQAAPAEEPAERTPVRHRDDATVDPVVGVVASVAGLDPDQVALTARLSDDLELDSLRRVELLGVIEEELGVYVDDDALEPGATVGDLRALVEAARGERRRAGAWSWPLSPAVRAIGLAFQVFLMYPMVALFYRVRTSGLEQLGDLDGPVLFTPNHCLHLDNAIILSRLPLGVRWRLSVAAAADTIYDNPVQGVLASVLANAFPLAREGSVRKSLEMLGTRLDRGFNVLIYPEGKLTVGGPLQPFKAGVGLIAVEGATPVVPVRLVIHRMSIIDRRRLPAPLRGEVEFVVGAPVRFDATMDPAAATTRLETIVAELQP
ncbi:MAG TPA: AMP-binding protein [Candidatus Limnocylindrales bacterium]|nr:AMP-binding protein [Candidatus Limnocylindrales bacterium]